MSSQTRRETIADRLQAGTLRVGARVLRTLKPSYAQFLDRIAGGMKVGSVRLEAASKCQLKCPMCPTGKGTNKEGVIGWGTLKRQDFVTFLEANAEIRSLELSNWGEVFLNPDLSFILEHAHARGVSVNIANGVNLNSCSEQALEAIVKFGVKHLTVSIDGASQETYEIYRVGGKFENVIENVKKLNAYKEKYQSDSPYLIWQFIMFGHNQHELPVARDMAAALKMNFRPKLCLDHWDAPVFSPVTDLDAVRKEVGAATREEFRVKFQEEYSVPCFQFWFEPQVNWDGKLLGCCDNVFGDYGNAFTTDLRELMSSERYVYTKKMLIEEKPARADIPCSSCQVFKRRGLAKALKKMPYKRRILMKWLLQR